MSRLSKDFDNKLNFGKELDQILENVRIYIYIYNELNDYQES